MLLVVEKELEEEYVKQFVNIQKLITNIKKIIIKTKNRHILNIGMYIICMVGQCLQKLPVNNLSGSKVFLNLMKIS